MDDKRSDGSPPTDLSHLNSQGQPSMVDVSAKDATLRFAAAEGIIRMSREALEAVQEGSVAKGSVHEVARLAGIMGGKRTGELIPLCHLLPGTSVTVDIQEDPELPGLRIRAEARLAAQTGVEMEALTAVSVTLLTVYDMLKSMDRGMVLEGIRLLEKSGGRSGHWEASDRDTNAESSLHPPDG